MNPPPDPTAIPERIAALERENADLRKALSQFRQTRTALKESEETFRALVEHAPMAITVIRDGKYIYGNPANARLMGLDTPEEIVGVDALSPIAPAYHDAIRKRMAAIREGRNNPPMEIQLITPSGSRIWCSSASVSVTLDGRPAAIIVGQDITERKEAEAALLRSCHDLDLRSSITALFITAPRERLLAGITSLLLDAFNGAFGYLSHLDGDAALSGIQLDRSPNQRPPLPEWPVTLSPGALHGIWKEAHDRHIAIRHTGPAKAPDGSVVMHHALVAPLIAEGRILGQVAVGDRTAPFTESDLDRLAALAEFIAPIFKIFLEKERAEAERISHARKLEEHNVALNVLLENRNEERSKLFNAIRNNFQRLVFPYYDKLKTSRPHSDLRTLIDIISRNTEESLAPLASSPAAAYQQFTPSEIQVVDLIKAGKTSKEIAALLNISPRSVFFHRNNIRRKLGIHNTKANLRSHLLLLQ